MHQKIAAKIIFGWQIKDITQSEHFSSEDGGAVYSGCNATDYRSVGGVMIAEVNHMLGLNTFGQYGLIAEMMKIDEPFEPKKTYPDRQKAALSEKSLQGLSQKMALECLDLLHEKIVIWVQNLGTNKIIGYFS